MEIFFKPRFLKKLGKLEDRLQQEAFEKIELFKNKENHQSLHVHKLHGHLKDFYGFSVNYQYRIIFEWLSDNEATFISIGTHAVYDE